MNKYYLCIVFTFLISCSSSNTDAPLPDSFDLDGSIWRSGAWQLENYTNRLGVLEPASTETPYQIKFDRNRGDILSYINCENQFNSTYEMLDDYIVIRMQSDELQGECSPRSKEIIQEQDELIKGFLTSATSDVVTLGLTVSSTSLELEASDGRMLQFSYIDDFYVADHGESIDLLEQSDWAIVFYTDRDRSILSVPLDAEWELKFRNQSSTDGPILSKHIGPCEFIDVKYSRENEALAKLEISSPEGPFCTQIPSVSMGTDVDVKSTRFFIDSDEFYVKQENPEMQRLEFYSSNGESFTLVPSL